MKPQVETDRQVPPTITHAISKETKDKPKIVSPINVERLEFELQAHPNQAFVNKLCTELREGARIGYEGARTPRISRNLPTALANPEKISRNLEKEISAGRVEGPFSSPPFPNFQVSPLGIIPKKNSDKFRTIFHLSYPKTGHSINSGIDKEPFSLNYITTDNAIEAIQAFGQGTKMAKTDIESAFRLYPVHPEDWELLGMKWEGKYFFEKSIPFGLRSGPFIFNQLAEAIEWILRYNCGISYVVHFLDDFLIMEPPFVGSSTIFSCDISLSSMLNTFKALGVPLSKEKTQGPTTRIEFLGIILDSERMEACLPNDKVTRLKTELERWSNKSSATLQEIQSLIGSLNFACKVIPPGRPFLQRIIHLTIGVTKPHHHISLNKGFFEDINTWRSFLDGWNGKKFFLNSTWDTSLSLYLYTDASGSIGYGGIHGNQWFQGKWPPHQSLGAPNISINWQELFAIIVACSIWSKSWSQKRVLFYCDNESVVSIINTKRSRCSKIMELVRILTLLTLKYNFYFKAKHISGSRNEVADALSRFQVTRFRQLAPWADGKPQRVPKNLSLL